jgi:hypothetical protein
MANALFRAGELVPRLHRLQTLRKYTIGATDGDVGGVDTIYFDDVSWTVRYLVVDTGTWLPGRKVLISPRSIERVDVERDRVVTNLTRERVENSPDIDTHKPVSRQQESRYYNYYGYPDYWTGPYRWGLWADPFVLPPHPPGPATGLPPAVAQELAAREHADDDPHLRSAAAVTGYGIQATDGSLGHVEDFLLDEPSWAIRYLILDPTNWWPGPHVVISTEWVADVDDGEATVRVSVDREAVRTAPTWDPDRPMERDWEASLHRHFDRGGYWDRAADSWRLRPPSR